MVDLWFVWIRFSLSNPHFVIAHVFEDGHKSYVSMIESETKAIKPILCLCGSMFP